MNSNQKKGNPQKTTGLRTIDIKHTELLDSFHKIETETIPKLVEEKENLKQKIKTFSIGFHEEGYNEAHHAKKVAEHLETEHTEYYCTQKEALEILSKDDIEHIKNKLRKGGNI